MNVFRIATVIPATILALSIAACNPSASGSFTASAKQYLFTPQGGSPASGNAKKVLLVDGSAATTLTVTGLTPLTQYAAHYHAKGTASSSACASGGAITEGFDSFTTDASGSGSVKLLSETSKITGSAGAYINVHLASSLATVPLCADLEQPGIDLPAITGTSSDKSFTAQGGSTASGMAKIATLSDGTKATTLVVTGLQANTQYAAHYHALGIASTNPCQSAGPVTVGFANFTTNASGNGTVRLLGLTAAIAGDLGAYINVHLASDLSNVPLCADLKK
jgi:superoxide dismutase, Cu-Zn family